MVYSIFCSLKAPKRREVCVSVFWRYLPFSVLGSKYLSLKVPKRQEVCVSAFWRYVTFSVLGSPKEMRGLRVRVLEICYIFCFGPAQAVARPDQSARLGSAVA
ncbi:uncharacterized protein LACBIDRAFT_321177 [Laccaria bicolor S238N-H82]|uniref:Predicted protein n=1 Tax=Laccaria bicolor (strain S238N-H82 / ATCC MYA-4686) TaxID=486041 RepID=B0CP00_LACBS|nr:uncharacterized protein LACBIDRAFT_321177 [Laccaria bicolor S238N-H82]EDR15386.1 predicted protein [Laccaria bicolor S238N-H82]|eukprot:XP_001873594.1 predicted protein [Laccaria bicolor S238N-H82]